MVIREGMKRYHVMEVRTTTRVYELEAVDKADARTRRYYKQEGELKKLDRALRLIIMEVAE